MAKVSSLSTAQQQLVANNYQYAMNVCTKFAGLAKYNGVPFEDIQQEAALGLCMAAMNYLTSMGSFQSVAYNYIKRYIIQFIRNKPLSSFEDKDISDVEVEDDNENHSAIQQKADALMSLLNPQELKVIQFIYGVYTTPMKPTQVAKVMRIQPARVRHIHQQALNKMESTSLP